MPSFDWLSDSLWSSGLLFVASVLVVWRGGSALAARADLIADRTGLGRVFAGAVLLGVATSLPEIATTISASVAGAGRLAGSNLLGGVAMQLAVLALVDGVALRGRALTAFSPRASLLLHGVSLIVVLALAAIAIVGPDVELAGTVSAWSLAIVAVYGVSLFVLHRFEGDPRWEPRGERLEPPQSARDLKDAASAAFEGVGAPTIALQFVGSAVVVFAGGWLVAVTGEAIAEQTGLGETLVGATLVAIATSLPEVSTTFGAVRFGAYSMAIGNILGTNALEVALFLPADAAYTRGSIFATLGDPAVVLCMTGIVLTAVYVWGVLERRDRAVGNFGVDSLLVLLVYVGGISLVASMS